MEVAEKRGVTSAHRLLENGSSLIHSRRTIMWILFSFFFTEMPKTKYRILEETLRRIFDEDSDIDDGNETDIIVISLKIAVVVH